MANLFIQFLIPKCVPQNGYVVSYRLAGGSDYTTYSVGKDNGSPITVTGLEDGSYEGLVEADYGTTKCTIMSFTTILKTASPPIDDVTGGDDLGGGDDGGTIDHPATLYIRWGWSPSAIIDPLSFDYQKSIEFISDGPLVLDFSEAPFGSYLAVSYPTSGITKTNWFNTVFNQGTIPDNVWNITSVINNTRYVTTRIDPALDNTQPIILS